MFAALINICQTWVKWSSLKNVSINIMEVTSDYLWKACAPHAPGITPILAVVAVERVVTKAASSTSRAQGRNVLNFGCLGTFVFLTLSHVGVYKRVSV